MSDPEIGKLAYTKRLDSIRKQLGVIMEVIMDLNQKEPGPLEKTALLNKATIAVLIGVDDLLALERFGAQFKQTGELKAEILKGRDK